MPAKNNEFSIENIKKGLLGVLGFTCLFITLYFWRMADLNHDELL